MHGGYHAHRQLFFQAAVDKSPGLRVSARHAAYFIVQGRVGGVYADGHGARREFFKVLEDFFALDSAVGDDRQFHAQFAHAGGYLEEILAQQRLAAHQGHAQAAGIFQVFGRASALPRWKVPRRACPPAVEPQCRHFRLQASVSSQTAQESL